MAANKNSSNIPKPKVTVLMLVGFIGLVAILLIFGIRFASNYRQQYAKNQTQQMAAPEEAVKEEVQRILLRRVLDDGTVQYIEILSSGQVNLYDADMNLIKAGITGYYKVDSLFDKVNRNMGDLRSYSGEVGDGEIELTIITNKGTYIIVVDDDILNDPQNEIEQIIKDIIDDTEDIADDTFAPTPTLAPTYTPAPGQPTPTPIPTLAPGQPTSPPLSATPGPSPTPTPLPDYMTAPPFDCDDYKHLNRPVNISNIICGVD